VIVCCPECGGEAVLVGNLLTCPECRTFLTADFDADELGIDPEEEYDA